MTNMARIERVVAELPGAMRVDVEEWGGESTFRVNNKVFVFTDELATVVCIKLSKDEAAAVLATDPLVEPAGYGLGRRGWMNVDLGGSVSEARWEEIREWVHTSYTLIAPRRLARTCCSVGQPDYPVASGRPPPPSPASGEEIAVSSSRLWHLFSQYGRPEVVAAILRGRMNL